MHVVKGRHLLMLALTATFRRVDKPKTTSGLGEVAIKCKKNHTVHKHKTHGATRMSDNFLDNFERLRRERGWSLDRVAKNAHIQTSSVCRFVNNADSSKLRLSTKKAIAEAFGVTPEDMERPIGDTSEAPATTPPNRVTGVRLEPEWHVLLANPADNDSDALRGLPEASVEVEELPPPARCDVPASELFAMQVSDDSSAPAIPAGSFVYVRRRPRYAPKGIVLAALGTAVVVRRLVRLTSASECELTRLDGTESETISTDWLRGTILCWQTSA